MSGGRPRGGTADATDLKSVGPKGPCGFESHRGHSLTAADALAFRPLLHFLHTHVLELDARAVAEEANVAAGAQQARVLLQDLRVLHVVEVGVDNRLAV